MKKPKRGPEPNLKRKHIDLLGDLQREERLQARREGRSNGGVYFKEYDAEGNPRELKFEHD